MTTEPDNISTSDDIAETNSFEVIEFIIEDLRGMISSYKSIIKDLENAKSLFSEGEHFDGCEALNDIEIKIRKGNLKILDVLSSIIFKG